MMQHRLRHSSDSSHATARADRDQASTAARRTYRTVADTLPRHADQMAGGGVPTLRRCARPSIGLAEIHAEILLVVVLGAPARLEQQRDLPLRVGVAYRSRRCDLGISRRWRCDLGRSPIASRRSPVVGVGNGACAEMYDTVTVVCRRTGILGYTALIPLASWAENSSCTVSRLL